MLARHEPLLSVPVCASAIKWLVRVSVDASYSARRSLSIAKEVVIIITEELGVRVCSFTQVSGA